MFSHMDPSKEGSSAITTEAVIQSQTKNEINVNVRWDPKYVRTYPGILKTFALVRLSKVWGKKNETLSPLHSSSNIHSSAKIYKKRS